MTEADATALIIGGDEVITPALQGAFHPTIQERVVATIPMDVRATPRQVFDATLPLAEQAEREREATAIDRLREAIGADTGVVGAEAVMTALQTGQVMVLIMNDDFEGTGWADYTMPVYGAGEPPSEHPAGGDAANLVPIRLEDEGVRLALQTDAEIEIVRTAVPITARELEQVPDADAAMPRSAAARALDEMGGIGALLRFALDADQATANL
jgi:peptide subunit release factor 1 (eRF1)